MIPESGEKDWPNEEKESEEDRSPGSNPFREKKTSLPKRESKPLDRLAEIYSALVLGTGDYIRKNGFQKGPDRTERRASIQP